MSLESLIFLKNLKVGLIILNHLFFLINTFRILIHFLYLSQIILFKQLVSTFKLHFFITGFFYSLIIKGSYLSVLPLLCTFLESCLYA